MYGCHGYYSDVQMLRKSFWVRFESLFRIRIFYARSLPRKETTVKTKTWVDNIKLDRREIGWDGMHWIDLAQDRDTWRALVNTVMDLRVP
jgi:hypothetical protein